MPAMRMAHGLPPGTGGQRRGLNPQRNRLPGAVALPGDPS